MPRRGNVPKRDVLPDPMYNSKVVTKLINQIMLDGKKGTAQTIVYDAFKIMGEKLNMDPMEIFKQAMENVMPVVEVKARRVGGANYQVPIEIRPERRQTLAIRWLVINTRKRSEREMASRLAAELMDAYNNTGGTVKNTQGTLYLYGKVNVAGGINDIDTLALPETSGCSRGNGNTSFLLLCHPVHGSCAFVSFTQLVCFTCVEQDTLGCGGLSGVNMSHDTDISGIFE